MTGDELTRTPPWPQGAAYRPAPTVSMLGLTGAGTASTTAIAAGWGAASPPLAIIPQLTGIVEISVSGTCTTATAATTVGIQLYYIAGLANAIAAGSALTGATAIGTAQIYQVNTAAKLVPFSITEVVSGLTLGTAYCFDAGYLTGATADHASLATCDVILEELLA
jgi:hypothetical protein